MKFLVMGGTGKVGSAAVRALASEGRSVRVLSRNPSAAGLPESVEVVQGDLGEPDTLKRAFQGVTRAALVPPLDPNEKAFGLNAIRAAAEAGVERFVYLSLYALEEMPSVVFADSKRAAERELEQGAVPFAVVRPNNYFQNDVAVRPVILEHGAYVVPLGPVGCHSIDTGDVGAAMAKLLTGENWRSRKVPVVGAEAINGETAAGTWAEALGREVQYGVSDLDAWGEQMRAHMPDWLVDNLVVMYKQFARDGWLAKPEDVQASEEFLGRPAHRYADFVKALASSDR